MGPLASREFKVQSSSRNGSRYFESGTLNDLSLATRFPKFPPVATVNRLSPNVKTKAPRSLTHKDSRSFMDLHIKLLQLKSAGNHLIVIVRGPIDKNGFLQVFCKAADAAKTLS